MLAFGLWWLARAEKSRASAGEGFGKAPVAARRVRRRAAVSRACGDRQQFRSGGNFRRQAQRCRTRHSGCRIAAGGGDRGQPGGLAHRAAATGPEFPRRRALGGRVGGVGQRRVVGARGTHPGHRHTGAAQPQAPRRVAQDRGRRRQCVRPARHQRREPGRFRRRGGRDARVRVGARLGARRSAAAHWSRWRSRPISSRR